MVLKATVSKNAGWLFSANVVANVIGFVLLVLLARFLGDEMLGLYSFAFAFTSIFALILDFGVIYHPLKEIARNKAKTKEYYGNVAGIKLVAGIIAIFLPIIILYFQGASALTLKVVAVASIAMFFNYFTLVFRMLFAAYEVMKFDAIAMTIERLVALVIGGTVLALGGSLLSFVLVLLLSYFIYFVVSYSFASANIEKFSLAFNFPMWKRILKKSLPFWFTGIFLKIYFQIDTVMLSSMKNFVVTGWYNAAYSLINGLSFIPFVISMVIFPVLAVLHKKDKIQLRVIYTKSMNYLFIIGFPIAIGTLLLAKRIILFLFEETFINAVPALQILIWAELFLFLNHFMGWFLNSIDKQKLFAYATGVSLVINIGLNFLLIPKYSYIGAAIATVITEIIAFSLLYFFTSREGYALHFSSLIVKPVVAGLVMAGLIYALSQLHLLIIIPVAGFVYVALLFLLKVVGREEIDLVMSMFKKH